MQKPNLLKLKLNPLTMLKTWSTEPPLAPGESRIPLLPSKMMESDGLVKASEARFWFWKCVINSYTSSMAKVLALTGPLYTAWAILMAISQSHYYGLASLTHAPFLYLLAVGNLFALFYTFLFAFVLSGLRVSPHTYTPFPDSVYLSKTGFAFGSPRRFISWDKVLMAKTQRLQFRGQRECQVLELYLDGKPYVAKQNAFQKLAGMLEIDGLQRKHHFMQLESKKSPENIYEGMCLRLPLELFAFDADCQKFLRAMREHVPLEAVQTQLPANLDAAEAGGSGSGFTEMWLSELRSPQSANTNRLLDVGHKLQNGLYELTGVLGYGGFSVVYSAKRCDEADALESEGARPASVAIKEVIINSGGTRASKESILRQIVSEIELLKTLDHPNIVNCLDYFIDSGRIYIVMQALQGNNLRNLVDEAGPMSEKDLLCIAGQCCSILNYLHTRAKPLMHRDFTPDNLIWDGATVKLVDFNVAEEINTSASQTIVGKHCFLAPEQWCGNFGPAGDLYQLGCTLYYLATGKDPEPLAQSNPATLRDDLPESFCGMVRKLTALEAADRFATAGDIARELESITEACRT